jgi:hypothetical protein
MLLPVQNCSSLSPLSLVNGDKYRCEK